VADLDERLISAYADRVDALEALGTHYRIGSTPPETLLDKLEASRERVATLQRQRAQSKKVEVHVHVEPGPRFCPACGHPTPCR
jgi:hypothetical protein